MMSDEDIREYHNIGKAIKKSEKYKYINGIQSTDHGSRIYDVAGYRLPSETTVLGKTKDQQFIKDLLSDLSIESSFIKGAPGVYVNEKKIASIGLRISKNKTYHGISINFDMDLKPFKYINPCGYEGMEVTQIKDFNEGISKIQLEKLVIEKLRHIF